MAQDNTGSMDKDPIDFSKIKFTVEHSLLTEKNSSDPSFEKNMNSNPEKLNIHESADTTESAKGSPMTTSERGFRYGGTLKDEYNSEFYVSESSSVSPSIWLRAKGSEVLHKERPEVDLLINLETATELRDQLTELIDQHFTNDLSGSSENENAVRSYTANNGTVFTDEDIERWAAREESETGYTGKHVGGARSGSPVSDSEHPTNQESHDDLENSGGRVKLNNTEELRDLTDSQVREDIYTEALESARKSIAAKKRRRASLEGKAKSGVLSEDERAVLNDFKTRRAVEKAAKSTEGRPRRKL